MSKQKKNAKAALEQLAEYLRRGWKTKYPVQETDLERLHEKMRANWKKKEQNKIEELRPPAYEDKVHGQKLGQLPEQEPKQNPSQGPEQQNDLDSEQENDQEQEHER